VHAAHLTRREAAEADPLEMNDLGATLLTAGEGGRGVTRQQRCLVAWTRSDHGEVRPAGWDSDTDSDTDSSLDGQRPSTQHPAAQHQSQDQQPPLDLT
jgi:hypothetical protein